MRGLATHDGCIGIQRIDPISTQATSRDDVVAFNVAQEAGTCLGHPHVDMVRSKREKKALLGQIVG